VRALRIVLLIMVLWVVAAIRSTDGPSQWSYDQATWDGTRWTHTGQMICLEED
jgi:hypothetical protein